MLQLYYNKIIIQLYSYVNVSKHSDLLTGYGPTVIGRSICLPVPLATVRITCRMAVAKKHRHY